MRPDLPALRVEKGRVRRVEDPGEALVFRLTDINLHPWALTSSNRFAPAGGANGSCAIAAVATVHKMMPTPIPLTSVPSHCARAFTQANLPGIPQIAASFTVILPKLGLPVNREPWPQVLWSLQGSV